MMATLYPDRPIASLPATIQKVFVANVGVLVLLPDDVRLRPPMSPRRPRLSPPRSPRSPARRRPSLGAAQSKADAFAGKIPPVSGQLYRKAGRFELTAMGNLSLNDAFFTKYFGGAKVGYHFTEHLSAAVHGAGGLAVKSNSAVVCSATRGCDRRGRDHAAAGARPDPLARRRRGGLVAGLREAQRPLRAGGPLRSVDLRGPGPRRARRGPREGRRARSASPASRRASAATSGSACGSSSRSPSPRGSR